MSRPRLGYRRIWILLRRESWKVNHKLVDRIYLEEGLEVRSKRRRKRASHVRVPLSEPSRRNEQWALDFVSDSLESWRRYRALSVIDLYSRECVANEVAFKMSSELVTTVLDRAIRRRAEPRSLTTDNGPELRSNNFDAWAFGRGIQLDFIRPGRPVEYAFIESFNGRVRDESLNQHCFTSVRHAQDLLEDWQADYNTVRPLTALGGLAPAELSHQPLGKDSRAARATPGSPDREPFSLRLGGPRRRGATRAAPRRAVRTAPRVGFPGSPPSAPWPQPLPIDPA
jgi:putative transposase